MFLTLYYFFLPVLVPWPASEAHQTPSQVVDEPDVKTRLCGCFRCGTFSATSRRACPELFWWPWSRSATAAGGTVLGSSSLLRRTFNARKGFDDAGDDGDALKDNGHYDLRDDLEPTGVCSTNVLHVIQRTSLAYPSLIVDIGLLLYSCGATRSDGLKQTLNNSVRDKAGFGQDTCWWICNTHWQSIRKYSSPRTSVSIYFSNMSLHVWQKSHILQVGFCMAIMCVLGRGFAGDKKQTFLMDCRTLFAMAHHAMTSNISCCGLDTMD